MPVFILYVILTDVQSMIRTDHTQSVTDFRANYAQVLERLDTTGDAEILTQNGQARAVILSPKAFDELMADAELARTMAMIRQSEAELSAGKGRQADDAFAQGRARLMGTLKQS